MPEVSDELIAPRAGGSCPGICDPPPERLEVAPVRLDARARKASLDREVV
jgi:hypothetical protein